MVWNKTYLMLQKDFASFLVTVVSRKSTFWYCGNQHLTIRRNLLCWEAVGRCPGLGTVRCLAIGDEFIMNTPKNDYKCITTQWNVSTKLRATNWSKHTVSARCCKPGKYCPSDDNWWWWWSWQQQFSTFFLLIINTIMLTISTNTFWQSQNNFWPIGIKDFSAHCCAFFCLHFD